MFSSSGGHVRTLGKSRFVDTLRGLDDFIQTRGDFGWGYTSAEDVARRDWGAVELAIGVFALDQGGSLQ